VRSIAGGHGSYALLSTSAFAQCRAWNVDNASAVMVAGVGPVQAFSFLICLS